MKNAFIVLLLASLTPSISFAADPCKTLLCMAGELQGHGGGSKCDGPIRDYYDIRNFHRGSFSPSRTKTSRASFMNKCPGAPSGWVSKIVNTFDGHL